jgi:hypothetical protein
LLGADFSPRSPAPSVGAGEAAIGIGKKVPEVPSGAESRNAVVAVDVPHKLTEEIPNRHLAEGEGRETVSEINFEGLTEHLLIAKFVSSYYFGTFRQDFPCNSNILMIKR